MERSGVELEQKYVVTGDRPWMVQTELTALLSRAGYEVRLRGEKKQEDTYYDTADGALLAGGCSLRVRRKGGKSVVTCKHPAENGGGGGSFARIEDELETKEGLAGAEEFVARCLGGLDLSALQVKAEVENLRRSYEVSAVSGARFELDFDDVCYRDPDSGRVFRERQVELELLAGSEAEFRRAVEAFHGKTEGLRAVEESKYQRAVRLTRGGG